MLVCQAGEAGLESSMAECPVGMMYAKDRWHALRRREGAGACWA